MRSLCVVLAFWCNTALAQSVDASVVGEWHAPVMGFTMVLRIDGSGRCSLDEEAGQCAASGGTLTWSGPEGSMSYRYAISGRTMTLSGGDLEAPVAFTRQGSAPSSSSSSSSPSSSSSSGSSTSTADVKASGPGMNFERESWGVKLTAPNGWKLGERNGVIIGGHDSEAGLMLLRFFPTATTQDIETEFAKGLREPDLTAMPIGKLAPFKKGSASGFAGEMSGALQDGNTARIRVVIAQSSFGGALAVMGITTEPHYPTLKARVEQLASTITFKKPKTVKHAALAGAYWFYAGSSSGGTYSREAKLWLCLDGTFRRQGEVYSSSDTYGDIGKGGNMAFGGSNNSGTWSAQGDDNSGTITLTYGNGEVAQFPYRVSTNPKDRSAHGPAMYFGSDLYQKTGNGQCN